ncbi:aspartic peptidase domain-containing protein [Cryomyces antarcticus]
MYVLQAIIALAALANLSLASPIELVGRRTFSVSQVPNGKRIRNGPLAMSKTYAKYAVEAPTDIKVAAANAAASQQGEVSNAPEAHDQSYLCPVTVGGQTLNLDFDTGSADLSINTVQPTQQITFFDAVKSTLAKPLFTAHLKKGAPGSYDFGYIDTSKYTGSITYADVDTSNGLWEFAATGYAVGSGRTVTTSYDSIADTGTSLLYLPTEIVAAYYGQVNGAMYDGSQGGYTIPCDSNLPNFVAIIGGSRHTVPGSYINYAPIGNELLWRQFVVFDGSDSPRVGFAKQA